jgi:hypothetical protein
MWIFIIILQIDKNFLQAIRAWRPAVRHNANPGPFCTAAERRSLPLAWSMMRKSGYRFFA